MTYLSGSQVFGGGEDIITVTPNLDVRTIEFVFETFGGDLGGPSSISFNFFVNGKLAEAVDTTLNTSKNQWASGTYSLDVAGAVSSIEIVLVAGWIAPKSLKLTTFDSKQSFSVIDGAQTSASRPSWAQQGWLVLVGEKLSYPSVGIAASQIQVDGGAGLDVLVVSDSIESSTVKYGDGVVTLTTKTQGTIVANNFEIFKFSNSTVSLAEIQSNRAPTFSNSFLELSVLSTGSKSVSLAAVDPDGDKLIYSIVTPATNGEASIVNGQLLYIPGKVGTNDTLQVAARDKFGATALQTFKFAVNPGTEKLSLSYKSSSEAMEMQRVGPNFVDNPLWQECTSWVVDLNGDGIDEILLLPSIYNVTFSSLGKAALDAPFYPRVLQVVDGKFQEIPVKVNFTIGQVNELLAADFDGDGVVELFFVDPGIEDQAIDSDKMQSGGYLRYLDVSFDGKSYTFSDKNAELDLSGLRAFWHEGALIDRNGDGTKEIIVSPIGGVNTLGQTISYTVQGKTDSSHYPTAFFFDNAQGKLLAAGDQLPEALTLKSYGPDGFYTIGTAGAGDLNGNGRDEAIFVRYANFTAYDQNASPGQDIIIWWDDGRTTNLSLPRFGSPMDANVYSSAYAGGKTVKVFDANGDGRNDIIIRWEGSGGKGSKLSQLIQLFIQRADGSFQDQTLESFGGYQLAWYSDFGATSPYEAFGQGIRVADANGDGALDLYFVANVESSSGQDYVFWLNDGLGHFAPVKLAIPNKLVGNEIWGTGIESVKSLLGNFDNSPGLDLAVFYFEQPKNGATIAELKDDKFIIDLYSNSTVGAAQAQLSQVRGYRAILPDGGKVEVGGSGDVIGSKGAQEVAVFDKAATIALDPSFNLGGDVLRFSKIAASYTVRRSGSFAIISDPDTSVTVPIGTKGMTIAFADGNRTLVYANGQFKLGAQVFSDAAVKITAQSEGAVGAYSLASVQSTVVVNDSAPSILGGNLAVFGSKTGKETIKLADGAQKVTLDASWNSGGDILVLPKAGSSYTIAKSGSVVTLSAESQTITVPVGIAGMTLRFTDGDRVLFYDTKDQSFKLSEQIITATANKVSELSQVISIDSSIYQSSVKTIDAGPMHYRFVDDPAKASSVVIEHAYVGDVLQLSATHKEKYEIKNIGNDLFVNLSINNVVSQVLVKDVIPNGTTVTDLASLTEALKWTDGTWNFLTFG